MTAGVRRADIVIRTMISVPWRGEGQRGILDVDVSDGVGIGDERRMCQW